MNKILVGFVCAVIVASFMTGILVKETLNQEEITEMREIQKFLLDKSNETPIVNVTVKIPDITVNLTNTPSKEKPKETEKIPEIITAESIGFVVLKLYYVAPYLHFWAESKVPREKITVIATEITTNAEKFDPGAFSSITDNSGIIMLDNQLFEIGEGNKVQLDFYYKGHKIATTMSSIMRNGKAGFQPVALTINNPTPWRVRIHSKGYTNWHFTFDGETNIPKNEKIDALVSRISPLRREVIPIYGDRFSIRPDEHNEIYPEKKHVIVLTQGHYKLAFNYNGSNCGELFGFEVERRRIDNETAEYKGIHWIKNVYVPQSAIV